MKLKFFAAALAFSFAPAFAAEQPPALRLPNTVEPSGYHAELTLDPAADTFTGHIRIAIDVKQPVQIVWLNANRIDVSQAAAILHGNSQAARVLPGGDQFLGLAFDSPLQPGSGELDIRYTAHVRVGSSAGVFRMEEDGNKFLFTQFEETDARAAFPCFDEPSFKVPWQLTLTVPQEDDLVSNTPVEHKTTSGALQTVVFKQTRPLPSYLVAFAIGKFDFVPAGFAGRNRAPVRIVTPRGHAAEAKYAAEVTATILTRLEEYFDIPFPYEKSDQVAIPVTYGFGAMENAGMVTYEQNILLGDPARDTTRRQRECASVEAHELAHQWFGDLVTMAWWNDTWLNEGFATWMEQKLIAEWKPEWETRVDDVNSKLGAEAEDTLLSARKVRQEIKTANDISNAFDGITYQKGAAVIGMFESWMSAPAFRKGVQNYLHRYAFKNATAPEFLAAVSEGGGKDIAQPFSTFLNQPGVPSVALSLECRQNTPVVHLAQERSLPEKNAAQAGEQRWQIPVCVRYGSQSGEANACTLLADPRMDWKLQANGCPAWIDGNAHAIGYYRVAYGSGLLGRLTKGDVEQRLSAPERVDLLGDAQALANNGKVPAAEVLGLVAPFHSDPNRYVVERAIDVAAAPRLHLVPENLLANYQRFVAGNFQSRAEQMGWISKEMLESTSSRNSVTMREDDNTRLLRPALVKFVATDGGDRKLADEAHTLAERWLADRNAIPADDAAAVLETAAYYGDKALWDKFFARLEQTKDHQERRRILDAMQSFRDPASIQAGMDALMQRKIPFIEGTRLLLAGQKDEQTRKLGFNFLEAHFDELAAMRASGAGADSGARFVLVGRTFCDAASEQQLKNFFEPRVSQFVGAPRLLAQTLESINNCIARKNEQQASVEEFLKGF